MFNLGILLVPIAIIGIPFVLLVLAGFYASRFKKVGPNQVLVVSGRPRKVVDPETGREEKVGYRIVKGGGTFIWPVLERVDELSMELMTIQVAVEEVYTSQGVPVNVDGVAQVKVRGDDVSIRTAAEQFLSKSVAEIMDVAHQTLAGHLRAILGTMTVEEIYKDRDAFAQRVQDVSAGDMANMGLGLVSFTIRDIHDKKGYLEALGQARTAEVIRDAEIGKALADRDARIRAAGAKQQAREAEFASETKIAESEKNYEVQKAAYDAEVNRRKAESELAYVLQQNITNQEVKEQEVQVEVIAKRKQIEVQEQEVARREKELEATVRKPAEAEQYRIRTIAEANKYQAIAEAEGQAEAIRTKGQAEAAAERARGLAQAEVIKQQGLSEAEAMQKKAAAWQQYTQAAIVQQLIDSLPRVAMAISEPLAKTEKIVVVSTGGDGAGSARVTQDIANIIAQVPATVEALTGIDLVQAIKNLPGTPPPAPSEPQE